MKKLIIFSILILVLIFSFKSNIYANDIEFSDIKIERYNNELDVVKIDDKSFYIDSNHHFISSLIYAITISSFDSISSDTIIVNENYYKYDIFKDNENITLVFYEFKDENDGTDIVLDLTKEEVYDIIDKVEEAHGID